jgi:hypothetical protein
MFEDMWLARVEEIQDLCCDACEPVKSGAPATSHKCKGTERSNWWGKGFDNAARQGDKDNINGYRSKAFGVMLAYDKPINNETRIGLGGGYANTRIDANNIDGNTKIDSYQITGYISHKPRPVFVQGALTAGVDKYNGYAAHCIPRCQPHCQCRLYGTAVHGAGHGGPAFLLRPEHDHAARFIAVFAHPYRQLHGNRRGRRESAGGQPKLQLRAVEPRR